MHKAFMPLFFTKKNFSKVIIANSPNIIAGAMPLLIIKDEQQTKIVPNY